VLDVGTGATLIYPLLGWKLFGWKFLAIDVNPQSCLAAQALVEANKLEEAI
jgi:23S rRNA (adenine1618-N6)-methyltransferase